MFEGVSRRRRTSLTGCTGTIAGIIMPRLIVQKTWIIPPAAKNLKSFEPEGTGHGSGSRFSLRVQKHLVMKAALGVMFQKISILFALDGHMRGAPLGRPFHCPSSNQRARTKAAVRGTDRRREGQSKKKEGGLVAL